MFGSESECESVQVLMSKTKNNYSLLGEFISDVQFIIDGMRLLFSLL